MLPQLLLVFCSLAVAAANEGTCSADWTDCRQSRCCLSSTYTCYEKDGTYSQCLPTGSCVAGTHPEDPVASPWTCRVLQPRQQTTPAPSEGHPSTEGRILTWVYDGLETLNAACGYAATTIGGLGSLPAQSPYIIGRTYCSASYDLFAGGVGCGACYHLDWEGGPVGGIDVQVINSNSMVPNTFSCDRTVTGDTLPFSNVSFYPVPCETTPGDPVVTMVSSNEWYVQYIFSNLAYPVLDVKIVIGHEQADMVRIADTAQFSAQHERLDSEVGLVIRTTDNNTVTLRPCYPQAPTGTSSCVPTSAAEPPRLV